VYFDFDQDELREADRATLAKNGETLKELDFLVVTIEGHADERGTIEYNLALSDRRARVVYDYLISVGIKASRIKAVAYGKEIPVCTESNEDCWQRNRRAHFAITGKLAQ
jgi:peptidoglycan-associated lipoprotein